MEELSRIAARAHAVGHRADVSLRLNPGIALDSHSNIATGHDEAKLDISEGDLAAAHALIDGSEGRLAQVGLSSHIGSMLTSIDRYARSARKLCDLVRERRERVSTSKYVDFGAHPLVDNP